jgi:hypothetical protein
MGEQFFLFWDDILQLAHPHLSIKYLKLSKTPYGARATGSPLSQPLARTIVVTCLSLDLVFPVVYVV